MEQPMAGNGFPKISPNYRFFSSISMLGALFVSIFFGISNYAQAQGPYRYEAPPEARQRGGTLLESGTGDPLPLFAANPEQEIPLFAQRQPKNAPRRANNRLSTPDFGLMRISISWGGGKPRAWVGKISVSNGYLKDVVSLGVDADISGSVFTLGNDLVIDQWQPNVFNGCHISIHAEKKESLKIELTDPNTGFLFKKEIPLNELVNGTVRHFLDSEGNQIEIERTIGDELPINVHHDSLVFEPGDSLDIDVGVRFLAVRETRNLALNVSFCKARSDERIPTLSAYETTQIRPEDGPAVFPLSIPIMPPEEGVYDVLVSLYQKGEQSIYPPRNTKDRILAQRSIQCVVISKESKKREVSDGNLDNRGVLLRTIDTTHPQWWKAFDTEKETFVQRTQQTFNKIKPKPDAFRWLDVRNLPSRMNWWANSDKAEVGPAFGLRKETEAFEMPKDIWKSGLGSGHRSTFEPITNLGLFTKIDPGKGENEPSWEAYSIPIDNPGKPHILEIDYPAHITQSMGISVIESSPTGSIWPISADSGIRCSEEIVQDRSVSRVLTHRILFWPNTKAPMVVFTNRQDDKPIVYGKIRIYRANDPLRKAFGDAPNRMFGAFLERPNYTEQFSGTRTESPYRFSGVSDWATFYEGANRLSDYLQWVGYGGMIITVAADGDVIYPSDTLGRISRYDTGAFLASGADPVRKDTLEMLARLFDRDHLKLVPGIDFNSPIPVLEEKLRQGGPEALGIRWIGPRGETLLRKNGMKSGRGQYYNLLNPHVQEAMLDVIAEMTNRYSRHPSFAGLAILLSPESFSQLPDESWGMDDDTIARFQRDMKIEFPADISAFRAIPVGRPTENAAGFESLTPGSELELENVLDSGTNNYGALLEEENPRRRDVFTEREEFIRTNCYTQWLNWRAAQVAQFYDKVRLQITKSRSDAKLYMAGTRMLEGRRTKEMLYPSLPKRSSIAQAMLTIGFDLSYYGRSESVVFLRPHRVEDGDSLDTLAFSLELESSEAAGVFSKHTLQAGSLFYHPASETTLPGFDEKSPYSPANAALKPFQVPADIQNRKRFIRHLASTDTLHFFDGGAGLHLGQEDSIRDLIATFRRLPSDAPFKTFVAKTAPSQETEFNLASLRNDPDLPVYVPGTGGAGGAGGNATNIAPGQERSTQPIILRTANTRSGTWCYIINDSPFYSGAKITFAARAGCQFIELSGLRSIDPPGSSPQGVRWSVTLRPYDLIAVVITDEKATPVDIEVSRSPYICGQNGRLAQKYAELGERVRLANSGILYDMLKNPGFEPLDENSRIPGWKRFGDASFMAALDSMQKSKGESSLKMSGVGPAGGVLSEPFPAPKTGRLFVWGELGIPEGTRQLPLRLSLVGYHNGEPFTRTALIGKTLLPRAINVKPVDGIHWHSMLVPFTNLPLEGLEQLSLRLDMEGAGTVWIDDMRLYNIAFTEQERTELVRMMSLGNFRLAKERFSDSIAQLEEFWPQMLTANIPLQNSGTDPLSIAAPAPAVAGTDSRYAEQKTGKPTTAPAKKEEEKKDGVFDKIRNWFK